MVPVLSTGYPVDIDSHSADVIYALDMFHHVKDARAFLEELNRLLKFSGTLFIESGHQPLDKAKEKIVNSGLWEIINEEKGTYKCIPVDNSMDAYQLNPPDDKSWLFYHHVYSYQCFVYY